MLHTWMILARTNKLGLVGSSTHTLSWEPMPTSSASIPNAVMLEKTYMGRQILSQLLFFRKATLLFRVEWTMYIWNELCIYVYIYIQLSQIVLIWNWNMIWKGLLPEPNLCLGSRVGCRKLGWVWNHSTRPCHPGSSKMGMHLQYVKVIDIFWTILVYNMFLNHNHLCKIHRYKQFVAHESCHFELVYEVNPSTDQLSSVINTYLMQNLDCAVQINSFHQLSN